jgi:hypothetical protein
MSDPSPTERSAATVQSRTLIRLAAAAVALFGMTVPLAWHAHWIALRQILPDPAEIKYNTDPCFILCGGGSGLLTNRFERLAAVFRTLAIVIATIVLLEYLTVMSFGVDQFFIRNYILSSTDFPGRMAQLSAGCFTLLGIGLVAAGVRPDRRWRLPTVAALALFELQRAIRAVVASAYRRRLMASPEACLDLLSDVPYILQRVLARHWHHARRCASHSERMGRSSAASFEERLRMNTPRSAVDPRNVS